MGEKKKLFKAQSKLRVFGLRFSSVAEGEVGGEKQDELKLRVDLRKEGEICQARCTCMKDPMTASRDFNGQ